MIDALTILRKELIELLGNRHSSRGALFQAGILVVMCGILLPTMQPNLWANVSEVASLYLMFPSMLASSVAADAFAGERERRTLETLLATPVSDAAIFVGKAGAAVCFSAAGAMTALLVSLVTLEVSGGSGPAILPDFRLLAGVIGGVLGSASLAAAVATAISMRVAVARSAQQMSSMLALFGAWLIGTTIGWLGLTLDLSLLVRIDLLMFAGGLVALRLAMRLFRRERFFEDR